MDARRDGVRRRDARRIDGCEIFVVRLRFGRKAFAEEDWTEAGGGRSEFRAKPTMKTDDDGDDGDEGLMRRAGRRGRDDGEGV